MKKRGLSTVVVTVLIILVAIIAVLMIWVILKDVIKKSASSIETYCLTTDLKIEKVEIDKTDDILYVRVKRNAGEGNLSRIRFLVYNETAGMVRDKNMSMKELEERTFSFGDVGNVSSISKLEIAPVVSLENKVKICRVSDSKKTVGISAISTETGEGCEPACNEGEICQEGVCVPVPTENYWLLQEDSFETTILRENWEGNGSATTDNDWTTGDHSVDGGTNWETAQEFDFTNSASWKSVTFNGSWTQAQLDALQVRLTSITPGDTITIYAMYAEITYTEAAAGTNIDPNADISVSWLSSDGTHYMQIDDGTRQPSAPDTSDWIYDDFGDRNDDYGMTTLTGVSSVSAIIIWAYGNNENGVADASATISVTDVATLLVNYTKLSDVVLWQVKDSVGMVNLTITADCFNYNNDKIVLKAESFASPAKVEWSCYNGSWDVLRSVTHSSRTVYEEATLWYVTE